LAVFGVSVPKPDCVVERTRYEVVIAWVDGQTSDASLMAFKVADEGVIMGSKVTDCI
jgi:hypothetical protein